MKKLKYSPDYVEKMRELKKYLDFRFGGDVRKKLIKEIGNRVRSLRENDHREDENNEICSYIFK